MVRTWLYLGDITGRDGDSQRYKELNRGRSDFFSTCSLGVNRSLAVATTTKVAYPASTGIGAEGRGLALGCLALASERDDVQTIPLENPRQTAAHDYGAIYSPQSPKFSRAMAVEIGTDVMILVSGTASITRSETQHLGDAVAQTSETLANIEALISEANLARHGLPGFGCTLSSLAVVRVYIKRQADYPAVCGDAARAGWARSPSRTHSQTCAGPNCSSRSKGSLSGDGDWLHHEVKRNAADTGLARFDDGRRNDARPVAGTRG